MVSFSILLTLMFLISSNVNFLENNKNINDSNTEIEVKNYFKYFDQFKQENKITDRDLILLGDFYLTCFTISNVFIRDYDFEDKDFAVIKINPEYLEEIKNNFIISPSSLPMVCKPEKWNDYKFGGFLENKFQRSDIVSSSSSHNINWKTEKIYIMQLII